MGPTPELGERSHTQNLKKTFSLEILFIAIFFVGDLAGICHAFSSVPLTPER
jgi:hypothetical protein